MGTLHHKSSRNTSLSERIEIYQEEQLNILSSRLARIEHLLDQEIKGETAQELYTFARELLVKINAFTYDPTKDPNESKKELERLEKAVEAVHWALENLEDIAAGGIHHDS